MVHGYLCATDRDVLLTLLCLPFLSISFPCTDETFFASYGFYVAFQTLLGLSDWMGSPVILLFSVFSRRRWSPCQSIVDTMISLNVTISQPFWSGPRFSVLMRRSPDLSKTSCAF
jgi:hypothetical protein